jgi:hypothetical protein
VLAGLVKRVAFHSAENAQSQTKFYTAYLGAVTRSSFTVFAHDSPLRSARFEAEIVYTYLP